MAASSRGAFPPKFNAAAFNVDYLATGGFNVDYRNWGGSYWFQNTRHLHYPHLADGDFDLMQPFFTLYLNTLELGRERTNDQGQMVLDPAHALEASSNVVNPASDVAGLTYVLDGLLALPSENPGWNVPCAVIESDPTSVRARWATTLAGRISQPSPRGWA